MFGLQCSPVRQIGNIGNILVLLPICLPDIGSVRSTFLDLGFQPLTLSFLQSKLNSPMSSQILRDNMGRVIAEIRKEGASLSIYNGSGKFLGSYHESRNITYDSSGRTVGSGNLLTMLIR